MRFQAVLFDLDGTLLDTLGDLADAMNAALVASGRPPRPLPEHQRMVGDGVRNYALRAIGSPVGDAELDDFIAGYRARYEAGWANKTRPYDGVPDMLAALVGAGAKLAVLSNKPDDFTRRMVEHYFPTVCFAAVRGAKDNIPLKPDPTAAVDIARELGIDPAGFLYVGDTDTDMRTGVNAGMFPVGAAWGFRDAAELRDNGAKAIINHPRELPPLLERRDDYPENRIDHRAHREKTG